LNAGTSGKPAVTRVLIIDDHPIVLRACCHLLECVGVDEIAQARSASEGFQLYRKSKPDVIILDLAMQAGSLNGLSFVRRLRRHDQEIPVLVFTMHSDPTIVSRALEAGASGYVLKDAAADELLAAFQRLRDGKLYLSHDLASRVVFTKLKERPRLTPREMQTLVLMAEGKNNGVIAKELNVSYKTVANWCAELKTKLGARSRAELMRLAVDYLPGSAEWAATFHQKRPKEPF
jgi:two-component system, NarL family, invasion response regulator UvrY